VLYVDRRNTLQPADQITGGQAEDSAPRCQPEAKSVMGALSRNLQAWIRQVLILDGARPSRWSNICFRVGPAGAWLRIEAWQDAFDATCNAVGYWSW